MQCSDGKFRLCFPVICAILADYEEQVLITGVKSGRQCTRCHVLPDKREDLNGQFAWRTKEATMTQIEKQKREDVPQSDDCWVHPIQCFAWHHSHLNIHQALATDILHLLLKGLIM